MQLDEVNDGYSAGRDRPPIVLGVAFARYSRDASFAVLRQQRAFVLAMAAGSIAGTVIGGLLLGVVPNVILIRLLVVLLILSAIKVWRHP